MLFGFSKMVEQEDQVPTVLAAPLELLWDMLNPEAAHQHDIIVHMAAHLQPAPTYLHRQVYSHEGMYLAPCVNG